MSHKSLSNALTEKAWKRLSTRTRQLLHHDHWVELKFVSTIVRQLKSVILIIYRVNIIIKTESLDNAILGL